MVNGRATGSIPGPDHLLSHAGETRTERRASFREAVDITLALPNVREILASLALLLLPATTPQERARRSIGVADALQRRLDEIDPAKSGLRWSNGPDWCKDVF